MNDVTTPDTTATRRPTAAPSAEAIDRAIAGACAQIAPAWPLDQSVAVNPWWPLRGLPIQQAAARVAARGGARALPDRTYLRKQWMTGRITRADLQAACREADSTLAVDTLVAHLDRPSCTARLPLVADQLDQVRDLAHRTAWTEEIVHEISQLCASEFDRGQGDWPGTRADELYSAWHHNVVRDRGIAILMGEPGLQKRFKDLPDNPDALIRTALAAMSVPAGAIEAYLHALLMSVNGWASWCAYLAWQAELAGQENTALRDLLAIRLAWDWVLYRWLADEGLRDGWRHALTRAEAIEADHAHDQRLDWIWLRALELGYQRPLIDDLTHAEAAPTASRPAVQAAFCIDVRSEVFRRALEAANPDIHTLGFAGFFGAPIAYQPLGSAVSQAQVPGLLAPSLRVIQESRHGDDDTHRRGASATRGLRVGDISRRFRWGSTSTFSYVESTGLFYAFKLLKNGLLHRSGSHSSAATTVSEPDPLTLVLTDDDGPLSTERKTELAAGILRGMSLTQHFAPIVMLAGHASQTRNNPQQSALDCGACGGHSGEINARVVAGLLNEPAVREGLREYGIEVPSDTRFVAALHNTTTDHITLFDLDEPGPRHAELIDRLEGWLAEARERANDERRAQLEPETGADGMGYADFQQRAEDWSQVRPEWGLARNASLIVAPRRRTRGLNLAGRAFLHEYEATQDPQHEILESIMTAPMIVAHWINFQYYASTVDNRIYGSGNKTLHNVAGGHIGLFEGNGGDLRIGLSLQSLSDGKRWVHEPLRLSVFIEAPAEAIADIVQAHEPIEQLVRHEWLFLYRLGATGEPVECYGPEGWTAVNRADAGAPDRGATS
ncbi:YbcC family protein [Salinisphaera hydrothermalis]|uniref:YbcC family protein n=1 Tax=Salinisphaera hydrothermalis TaxID=563188 RepID=UPI003340D7E2